MHEQVIEKYNPPLTHWEVDWTTGKLAKIQILQKQILPGATQPSYTYLKEGETRKFTTATRGSCAGYPDEKEALRKFLKELGETIEGSREEMEQLRKAIEAMEKRKEEAEKTLREKEAGNLSGKPDEVRTDPQPSLSIFS